MCNRIIGILVIFFSFVGLLYILNIKPQIPKHTSEVLCIKGLDTKILVLKIRPSARTVQYRVLFETGERVYLDEKELRECHGHIE